MYLGGEAPGRRRGKQAGWVSTGREAAGLRGEPGRLAGMSAERSLGSRLCKDAEVVSA